MKPNEEIPEEQRDRLFLMLRSAMERVAQNYETTCVGVVPEGVSVTEEIKRTRPMWWLELTKIENALNSYDQTDTAYQALCERYVRGWTAIFTSVSNNYKTNR